MIKAYALDFLNNEFYDKDVISEDGKMLFSAKDPVTSDALLKLYYKNIYVQNPITENKLDIKNNYYNKQINSNQNKYATANFGNVSMMEEPIEKTEVLGQVLEKSQSGCRKDFCNEIIEYSTKIGVLLEFSADELQELEKLAYYYVIDSMGKPIPDNMEKLVSRCYKDYKIEEFALIKKVPYQHIIFIVNYYVETLERTQSKQKTISKMLYLGTNKFNPFVLHKFLNMIKK
jgi:hypothetical protein